MTHEKISFYLLQGRISGRFNRLNLAIGNFARDLRRNERKTLSSGVEFLEIPRLNRKFVRTDERFVEDYYQFMDDAFNTPYGPKVPQRVVTYKAERILGLDEMITR